MLRGILKFCKKTEGIKSLYHHTENAEHTQRTQRTPSTLRESLITLRDENLF
jgi:hypothetical protein